MTTRDFITTGTIPDEIKDIVTRIEKAGGRGFLVGGAVIDIIQGREPKDWDIEVFGLSFERLTELFSDKKPKLVGKEFGIMKLSAAECGGFDVDINVPRKDNKVGLGHTGFDVMLDPGMSPEEACTRRDFTINAMALDLSDGSIVDPRGGMRDLDKGILRATNDELFVQDPLRALRAMQLLARKARVVDEKTMGLIRSMIDMFPELAKERVHGEFKKLLLKAPRPSIGLEFLRESGWLVHFPELQALIGCEQNPEWHPEGDVWIHSCHTVDSAAWVRDQDVLPEGWTEAFMFGTLCHDLGKPDTTITPEMIANDEAPKERLWTAWGHDRAGIPHVERFLRRMTNEKKLINRSSMIVGEHMQPFNLANGEARKPAWKKLHNKLRLDVLGWMCKCDSCGNPDRSIGDPDLEHQTSEMCWSHFGELGADPIEPILMGRHLIQAGFDPGPDFKKLLDIAFEAQIQDETLGVDDLVGIALSSRESSA